MLADVDTFPIYPVTMEIWKQTPENSCYDELEDHFNDNKFDKLTTIKPSIFSSFRSYQSKETKIDTVIYLIKLCKLNSHNIYNLR